MRHSFMHEKRNLEPFHTRKETQGNNENLMNTKIKYCVLNKAVWVKNKN